MADLPRAEGWHVWGSYPGIELCMDAITEVKEDRIKNGMEDMLFAMCKEKRNPWLSPSLTLNFTDYNICRSYSWTLG